MSLNVKQLTFSFGLPKDIHDLCVSGILAQSPDQVTTLGISYFHLAGWCSVKQLERIFEVCEQKEWLTFLLIFFTYFCVI